MGRILFKMGLSDVDGKGSVTPMSTLAEGNRDERRFGESSSLLKLHHQRR